jgi:hypothetical protein
VGYARPKWVVAGEDIEYLVHATEEVRMGLWRYGLEKERIERLGWHKQETGPWAGVQHTPDDDYTQTGVGWEGLGPDHLPPPSVEAPDRPLAHAREPLDANRDDHWRHPNHEYRPLSFDRPHPGTHVPRETEPTDPVAGSNCSHLAPAEWRFPAWLERGGTGTTCTRSTSCTMGPWTWTPTTRS